MGYCLRRQERSYTACIEAYRNPSLTRQTPDLKSQARILCQSFRCEFQKVPAKQGRGGTSAAWVRQLSHTHSRLQVAANQGRYISSSGSNDTAIQFLMLPCELRYRVLHNNRNSNTVTVCTVTGMAAVHALQTVLLQLGSRKTYTRDAVVCQCHAYVWTVKDDMLIPGNFLSTQMFASVYCFVILFRWIFQNRPHVYLFECTTGESLLEGGEVSIIWEDEVASIHIGCPAKQLEGDFGDNTKDCAGSS